MHRFAPQMLWYRLSRTIGAAPDEKQLRIREKGRHAGRVACKSGANHACGAQAAARRAWRLQATRMLERKASISERRTSASRRSAPEAFRTSDAADPASAEAVETPMMLLETSLVPPAAC